MFDDTDRWLSNTEASTVSGFLRDIIRWLTELLGQALDRIRQDDLQPIVVFDDTDRWLSNIASTTGRDHQLAQP